MKPVDIVVVMLVTTLCIIVLAAVVGPFFTGHPLTESNADRLTGIVGSLISIVSLYVGAKIQQRYGRSQDNATTK